MESGDVLTDDVTTVQVAVVVSITGDRLLATPHSVDSQKPM